MSPDELLALDVAEVDVDRILPIRTRVLRPHFDEGQLARWPRDLDSSTHHFAALDEAGVVACVTFQLAPYPLGESDWDDVQLRGMAVDPRLQNQGVGARLLEGAIPRLPMLYPDARRIWCNARERAQSFYERAGFEAVGDYFDKPGIGPHIVMWKRMPSLIA